MVNNTFYCGHGDFTATSRNIRNQIYLYAAPYLVLISSLVIIILSSFMVCCFNVICSSIEESGSKVLIS